MKSVLTRRSIRKYTSQPVLKEDILELLKAAMSAPSAGNQQPWQFIVINERKILDKIPSIHPHAHVLNGAQVAILVCGDLKKQVHEGYWVQDCAAATENILIAANAKGFGAVWLGTYPRETRVKGLQEILKLPEHVIPFALIPIGHPAEEKTPSDRFDKKNIHFNQW